MIVWNLSHQHLMWKCIFNIDYLKITMAFIYIGNDFLICTQSCWDTRNTHLRITSNMICLFGELYITSIGHLHVESCLNYRMALWTISTQLIYKFNSIYLPNIESYSCLYEEQHPRVALNWQSCVLPVTGNFCSYRYRIAWLQLSKLSTWHSLICMSLTKAL